MRPSFNRIQVAVTAIGSNLGDSPKLAMILESLEGERLRMPVFFPTHRNQLFLQLFKQFSSSQEIENDIVDDFARSLGYTLRSLFIRLNAQGVVVAFVEAIDEYGSEHEFEVTMHQGVIFAYCRNLPIYVQEMILTQYNARINYIKGGNQATILMSALEENLKKMSLYRLINDGVLPSEVPNAAETLEGAEPPLIALLRHYCVAQERYEWAHFLQQYEQLHKPHESRDEEAQE